MGYHARLSKVNDRPGMIAMASIFSVATILSVVLRFYARRLKRLSLGADDWLALASVVFVSGLNVIFIAGTVQRAITGHSPVVNDWPVSTPLEHLAQKYKYAFQITEKVAFGLIKLSILFLWKRLFAVMRSFYLLCWVMIVIIIAWTVAFLFATVFQCGTNWAWNWAPIAFFLTQCTNTLDMLTVFTATDVFTDFIIMFMPLPMIWKLRMEPRKKIGVTGVFLVGLFTIGAGVARMYIYLTTSYDKEDNPDFIADFTLFMLWSEIEVNVAMIVCCMPTFLPIINKARDVADRLSRATRSSGSNQSSIFHGHGRRSRKDIEKGEYSSKASLHHGCDIWRGKEGMGNLGIQSTATHDDDIEAELHRYGGIMAHTEITNSYE